MSHNSDGTPPEDSANTSIPDASDTIARLRDAAQRRAKQRRARTRADASAHAELDAIKSHAHTLEAQLAAQSEQLAELERNGSARALEREAELEEARVELEQKLGKLQAELVAAQSAQKAAQARADALQQDAASSEELSYRVSTLEAESERLRKQVRESQLELELAKASGRALDELRAKYNEVVAKHQALTTAHEELSSRNAALQEAHSRLEADLHNGAQEREALVANLDELRAAHATQHEELKARYGELERAHKSLSDRYELAKEDAALVEEAMSQLEQTQFHLREARETADTSAAKNAELEAALQHSAAESAQAKAALEAERAERRELDARSAEELDNLRGELSLSIARAQELQEAAQGSQQHIERLNADLQEVAAAAAAAEQSAVAQQATWEEAVSAEQTKAQQLADRLDLAQGEMNRQHQKLLAEQQARATVVAEFEALQAAVEEQLEADADASERELELLAEIDLLRASRDEVKQALDALVADREFTKDVTVAQAELERNQTHVSDLEAQLEEQRVELQQLQRDFEGARAAYDDASNRVEQMQAQLSANRPVPAQTADAAPKIAQYEAEMAMARQIIGNLEEQCEAYETRISSLQRDLSRAEGAAENAAASPHPHLRAVKQRSGA